MRYKPGQLLYRKEFCILRLLKNKPAKKMPFKQKPLHYLNFMVYKINTKGTHLILLYIVITTPAYDAREENSPIPLAWGNTSILNITLLLKKCRHLGFLFLQIFVLNEILLHIFTWSKFRFYLRNFSEFSFRGDCKLRAKFCGNKERNSFALHCKFAQDCMSK